MKRLLVLALAAALGGCATSGPTKNPPGAPNTICMPCGNDCQYPCTPTQAQAAAPKPAPVPKPTPPPPPPPPPQPAQAAAFDPPGGTFESTQTVRLTSPTPGAVIHCTTDGTPATADSPVCSDPITVDKTTTVSAVAVAPGAPPSDATTATYTIQPPPPPPRVTVTEKKIELTEKVFFDTGKATIKKESQGLLDEVAAAMKEHPELQLVRVEGHTDSKGGAALNRKLSQSRAGAVRQYLVSKGVEAKRLQAKGFGPSRPIADNKTDEGREKNRRVEFVIVKRSGASS